MAGFLRCDEMWLQGVTPCGYTALMTNTEPNPYRNAEDVRHALRIAFQPAVSNDPAMLARVLSQVADDFVAHGVTLRRLDNALATVSVPEVVADTLRYAVRTEGAK